MISLDAGVRIYLACGVTDMRKGMTGLAMLVQQSLAENPFDGAVYAFRGRRAGLIKLLWHDGVGLSNPCSQNLCKGDGVRRCGGGECRGARDLGAVDGKAPRWRAIRTRPCPAGRNCPRHTAGGLRL